MHEARPGPLKDAVSAQKALQGSKTDTRELQGGTEEKNISLKSCHWFALKSIQFLSGIEGGAVSAQKALQGSETKTKKMLIGTKENTSFPYEVSLLCP